MSIINYWDDLGATAGRGIQAHSALKRATEEQARRRALEDEDRAIRATALGRQTAREDYDLARTLAPGLLDSKQYEAAAGLANNAMSGLRGAGFTVPNAPIAGGIREITRRQDPTPTTGPLSVTQQAPSLFGLRAATSLPTRLDGAPEGYGDVMTQGLGEGIGNMAPLAPERITERDFSNPQTQAAIRGAFGIQAPVPEGFQLSAGQSRYGIGPDGKPELLVTAPTPDNPYRMRAEVQEELRRLGIASTDARQQVGIAAANARQDKALTAQEQRQRDALNAGDAKTFQAVVSTLVDSFPNVRVTSGTRSPERQQELWDADLASNGGKPTGKVARPGHSAHETGLARDVYLPPEERTAFIKAAVQQGLYVKADYEDGHIHIAVPQGVRPAPVPKKEQPKLVTRTEPDGTRTRVPDKPGVDLGAKPKTTTKPKVWSVQDTVAADKAARNSLGIMPGMPISGSKKALYDAEMKRIRRDQEAEWRKASGEPSKLETLLKLMEDEKGGR